MAIIKGLNFGQKLAVGLGILIYRLWALTLRLQIAPQLRELLEGKRHPQLILLWHNRLALALAAKAWNNKTKTLAGLVSASKDGAFLSEVMIALGIVPIRGSSSRRAVEATREVLEAIAKGMTVVITPDGPRGPVYTIKEGLRGLVERYSVATVTVQCSRYWELRSWDKFRIPAPFSTLEIKWEDHPAGSSLETIKAALSKE